MEQQRGSLIVYNQGSDNAGDPGTQGEKEDNEEGAAAFVDNCKRREDDAQDDAPERHYNYKLRVTNYELHFT